MIGELTDQPPFLIRKLGARARRRVGSSPSRTVASFRVKMRRSSSWDFGWPARKASARSTRTPPSSKDCSGKTEHPVAALRHLRPHVVERIRQQRQGAHVLDRILSGAPGNDVRKPSGLEPCREQFGRPAHDLAQLRLAQRRHIDLPMHLEKWFVFLQLAEKIRTHAHQRVQTRIGNACSNHLRKPAALVLLGANVQLLALVDIEEKGRRAWSDPVPCSGARWRRADRAAWPCRRATARSSHSAASTRSRISRVKLPSVEKRLDQRLERLGPWLEREEAPAAAFLKGMRPARALHPHPRAMPGA